VLRRWVIGGHGSGSALRREHESVSGTWSSRLPRRVVIHSLATPRDPESIVLSHPDLVNFLAGDICKLAL